MRKLFSNPVFGFRLAVFALTVLAASPIILFKFGVDWLKERVESRWPGNYRAQIVSFWIGLLAPVLLNIILLVVLWLAIAWLRARRNHS